MLRFPWILPKWHCAGRCNFGRSHLLPFLSPRLANTLSLCSILKGSGGKGRRKSKMSALLSLWKKGQGRAGCGQITSTSLFAPASAPGELGVHRRNQKTWVPVPALPLTAFVTLGKLLDISESQFHYRMLWGLNSMVYRNVICSLPTSVETIFITMALASSLFLSSVLTCAILKTSRWLHSLCFSLALCT